MLLHRFIFSLRKRQVMDVMYTWDKTKYFDHNHFKQSFVRIFLDVGLYCHGTELNLVVDCSKS